MSVFKKGIIAGMFGRKKNIFPGGIHPTDGRDKMQTYDKAIEPLSVKDTEPLMTYEQQVVGAGDYTRQDLLGILEEKGLKGMGGAGFPTYLKYRTDKDISVVLINGAECEPYLTCDYRLMLECTPAVVNGVLILLKAAGAGKAVICIEDNKKKAAEKLAQYTGGLPDVEIKLLPTKYPQGGERQLIQTVIGKEVPKGGFPADVGVIVSNVATAKAAADAVLGKKYPADRVVTVSGAVKSPGNYRVPVGTPLRELLLHCGGVTAQENMVILGGPMTGKCVAVNWDGEDMGEAALTTSGLLVLPANKREVQPCIRCGACIRTCPAGLAPINIETAFLKGEMKICEKLYASECISCGCCSYVCPAKRELALHVTEARDKLRQKRREEGRERQVFHTGPYLRSERTTGSIMRDVTIALLPALLGAVYFFGIRVVGLAAASVSVCVLTEYIWQKVTGTQVTVGDFSAVVTGLLLAMNLPVTTPYGVLICADIFSILAGKQLLGGIGNNFVNPALLGRLFVMTVWPGKVMRYVLPLATGTDAVTSATILGTLKSGGENPYTLWQMFTGAVPGSLGETSKLLLLAGFAYLWYKGVVNVWAAFIYVGTVAALTFFLGQGGTLAGNIPENILSGGLILGACFMLTDYMFVSRSGKILYAFTAGALTAWFRLYSSYPEGVCFGILTANCLAGVLSLFYHRHVYGVED